MGVSRDYFEYFFDFWKPYTHFSKKKVYFFKYSLFHIRKEIDEKD